MRRTVAPGAPSAENLRGSALMIAAMFGFAVTDMFIKLLGAALPTGQILATLGAGGALVFGVLARRRGETLLGPAFVHPAVLWRNGFEILGTLCFISAIVHAPLSVTSAILQANPLVVTLGAALWLGEPVGTRRWSAIGVGLVGVLLVIQPWNERFEPASLPAVGGVFGLAGRDLATRRVPDGISSVVLSSYALAMLVPAGLLLLALPGASAPTLPDAGGRAAAARRRRDLDARLLRRHGRDARGRRRRGHAVPVLAHRVRAGHRRARVRRADRRSHAARRGRRRRLRALRAVAGASVAGDGRVSDPGPWPADYFASRARFVETARACGARTESCTVAAVGPRGEPLSVDVATLGARGADHLIVVTSGVHGIEGFLGAAVQHELLRRLAGDGLPDGVGVALVHAVNPWGFAHLRRVDETNADVNRNFVGSVLPEPASPAGYAELDPVINPRGAPRFGSELGYWLKAGTAIARSRGVAPLAKAIAEGQYEYPRGLFYGGTTVGESCRTLRAVTLGLVAGVDRVSVLDVHSGLGPSATATLICNANVGTAGSRQRFLREHYRRKVLLDGSADNAYDARGTFARWCGRALADVRFLYACVEIGTVNPLAVLSALRRENRAHHWCPVGSGACVRTKRALLEAFAPGSPRWRRASVAEALDVFDRTLALPASPGGARA